MIINNTEVFIENAEIILTYQSLIEGIPNTQINQYIIQYELEKLNKKTDKVFLVNPQENPIGIYCFKLILKSDWISGDYDYSSLGVIFFTNDNPWNQPLETIIQNNLKELNWQENALQYRI